MNLFRYITLVSIVFLINSCGKQNGLGNDDYDTGVRTLKRERPIQFESPEALIAYVDDSEKGFVRTKVIREITYSACLKPLDYLLAQKRIKEKNDSLKKEDFEDLQYFDLRINITGFAQEFIKFDLNSSDQYNERINYCAFKMQNDIVLIDGLDTLNCVLYHFERAFDVVPYGHFLLGFEANRKKSISTKTLVFNDHLFNNGMIKFTFMPELMVKEPILL